ncbi:hypothetical protein [Leptolyngbya ohadii]|uniref:hypothetical protein n=1 Tax=Leptolyngbya ohadii TaxID=1962290 RepID=UPI000B598769|nr:hypothetical protein [Leptolyngbya ohadii]
MNRSTLRTLCGTISLTAALLPGFSAMAQTIPVPAPAIESPSGTQPDLQTVPQNTPTTLPNRSIDQPTSPQPQTSPQPLTQEPALSCPAGQFASAFPDVTPDHWAFEAVNRLASVPQRCFPTQS